MGLVNWLVPGMGSENWIC